ncbi:hypothetical protein RR48_03174 [Papilio machaon]|uniref:CCHC-type domain-containing protein n=1 Tax=Papilio machaon TaxID=76193 RepID=A0A0N0PD38_PAPMA|nr:hypothetical protein RR48_03174 [Papilio machaon]
MYNKLCAVFEGSEERNKSSLLQDFFNFKFENQKMSQLITDIENLRMRLNNLNQNIDDDMVISKILTCLPNQYKFFITAWESTPDDKKTLTNLTNRLLSEENRFTERKTEYKQVAFKAENKNIKCFKCHKIGHLKKDCKMCIFCKRYNHEEKDCKLKNSCCSICKKNNHTEENCFFKKKGDSKKYKNVAFLTQNSEQTSLKFIVDSGSTVHMTNDPNILSNFEEMDSTVYAANNEKMKAQGSGTVHGMSCDLQKTLFIPDLATYYQ